MAECARRQGSPSPTPHHIVDADDVAQANADGVLLEAQADVYAASLSRLKPPGPKAMT
jgi:hypothetical protein